LGYNDTDGAWRHPERTAVFLGDLIDRGPQQLATIELVRRMADVGSARCIMGNHEFNAIAWVTPDPEHPGKFLRDHHKPGNRSSTRRSWTSSRGRIGSGNHRLVQNAAVVAGHSWLTVGACLLASSPRSTFLQKALGSSPKLTDEDDFAGKPKGHALYEAIEIVCKGLEVELPAGISFKDKEGKLRHEVRVRWWQEDLSTYRKAAIGPPEEMEKIPDAPMPAEWAMHPYAGPPVLFGHYWFTGTPNVISPRFACLTTVRHAMGRWWPIDGTRRHSYRRRS